MEHGEGPLRVRCGGADRVYRPSASPSIADILLHYRELEVRATSGLLHRSKRQDYSITSSARASTDGGRLRPSAFAVVRLMVNSNLVGCSTGMSAGLAPRRTLSINSAVCRNVSGKFPP